MTTRRLMGVQRIGPRAWKWGCWDIVQTDSAWFAFDMRSELTTDQWHARHAYCFDRIPRDLLLTLDFRGNEPLDADGIAALQANMDWVAAQS